MSDSVKIKNPTPFLQAVLKLDNYFSELIRLGEKIETMDMKSDFDFEQADRLIKHFAECGEGVSHEIVQMSNELSVLRQQAEASAKVVAERAEQLQAYKEEQHKKMDEFRQLGEKVRNITATLQTFKLQEGAELSAQEREEMTLRLEAFETQLLPLIEEAHTLKKQGQQSKMKILESSADSLGQSLQAVSQKIKSVREQQPFSAT